MIINHHEKFIKEQQSWFYQEIKGFGNSPFPFYIFQLIPLAIWEAVFIEVILIAKVAVAMNVTSEATKYKHGWAIDHSRVIISRCWWKASVESTAPRLFSNIKSKEVIEHPLAIVSAKDIDGIFVGNYSVLAPTVTNEACTFWQKGPLVDFLTWS